MQREVAIKKLGGILGKSLGYRVDPKAPKPDDREAAMAELPQAREERDELSARTQARRDAILAADDEYQSLQADYVKARQRVSDLGAVTRHYRITVGTSNGLFFTVKAEGDSWEEVIEKLTAKKNAA